MLPRELLASVRKLEIRTRRTVDDLTAGAYHSVFKGRGIEFEEARPYTPGDDVRDIDWNVTARMGEPFIKTYVEERELTVMLVVDLSASQAFGGGGRSKRERAAEIAAVLALSAIRNHDKVGLLLFTDHTELHLPPRSGRSHGLRLIREVLGWNARGRGTDLGGALTELMRVMHKRAVVFLVSDFLVPPESYVRPLRIANRRHDLVAVRTYDPLETAWPPSSMALLEDAETGAALAFPGGRRAREAFARAAAAGQEILRQTCRQAGVDVIELRRDEDFVKPLMRFFRTRQARR